MILRWKSHLALLCFIACALGPALTAQAQVPRVLPAGETPDDARLQALKDLDGYFPMTVPESPQAWQQRSESLRRQVLVATGLWPMPEKTPLNAVIHGKVQREGFTVEKVYFESLPGHFVSGLLFRPDDGKSNVKRPAVLCPHGHGGRDQDHGVDGVRQLIVDGQERFESSGRFPKLARCAQLARMGCVTFIFDMLGYVDSQQISYDLAHRYAKRREEFESPESFGLFSAQAEMRMQTVMGLQVLSGIRCLDFLESLPDVDPQRIGVTGNSGGGTQTILLCAIDPRPIASFANGMVSTSMQGGCTCENCDLLRVGTGNVELAALFAPRPQGMTAADDWTHEMLTKGFPELKRLYQMLGTENNVMCRDLTYFPHNFNYVSRATMYVWLNKHMNLGFKPPIVEEDYPMLTPQETTVWDDQHPAPPSGPEYERQLMRQMADASERQIASLWPRGDQASLAGYRQGVGQAWQTIFHRNVPAEDDIQRTKKSKHAQDGYLVFTDLVSLKSKGEQLPVVSLYPTARDFGGDVVLWADPAGYRSMFDEAGKLIPPVQQLIDQGAAVVSGDLFMQGDFLKDGKPVTQQRVVENPRQAPCYTYCYNDPLFVRRVHDCLTLIRWVRSGERPIKQLRLIGRGQCAPIALAARAIAGDLVDQGEFDIQGFRFASINHYRDPMFLPGAIKYGDVPSLMALNAPLATKIITTISDPIPEYVFAAFRTEDAEGNLTIERIAP